MADCMAAHLRELMMSFQNQQIDSDASSDEAWPSDPEAQLKAMGIGLPGGQPMPTTTNPADVRKKARSYATTIFDCHLFLSKVLDRNEETIYKRWLKKTRSQRCKILASAWPDMASAHRPDFVALRAETEAQRISGTRYRDSFLMSYINMEDLSRSRSLPLFLHARGHHLPGDFAFSDLKACDIGKISKAIVPDYLNEHVMMFTGRNSASGYGELICWHDDPAAFTWMNERTAPLPGEGFLALEIQSRLYQFLRECCILILRDVPLDKLTSDAYEVRPRFNPPSENDSEIFSSLTVLATEAPYRCPASLSWECIKTLLVTRRAAAEDHIWSLREDPSYFADSVFEYRDHRLELLKDSDGKSHPVFVHHQEEIFWTRVLGTIVKHAYLSLEDWHELAAQGDTLDNLARKYASKIKQTDSLPQEYLVAILKFEHYLKQAAARPMGTLHHSVVASPPFRPYFERIPPPDIRTTQIGFKLKVNVKFDKAVEHLLFLLQRLWEDDYQLFLLGITNVVDELQRLIQGEPKASDFVSTFLAEVIGDLSITCECLRQVQTYYPWAAGFENASVDHAEDIEKQHKQQVAPRADMITALKASEGVLRLGNPVDGKFKYPIDKRRTKDNVDQLRKAEGSLDTFWKEVDRVTSKANNFPDLATGRLLKQSKILKRTPEWVEPSEKPDQVQSLNREIIVPLSATYFEASTTTFDVPKRKDKKKTRGVPSTKQATTPPVEIQADKQPLFELDSRAVKVFRTLFYTPSLTATPGAVPWTDFVHAMVSTGFSAEKLYGSVWQFSPATILDVNRSIQFHEPHPTSKLPYRTARRFGRRLYRAYGWHGEMFIQKS